MQIIKVKFLKGEIPSGKAYTYFSDEDVSIGDLVQINSSAKGIVTEVDVLESEIEAFRDKVKTIKGKIVEDTKEEFEKYLKVVKNLSLSEYESKDTETKQDIDIDYVEYLNSHLKKLKEPAEVAQDI